MGGRWSGLRLQAMLFWVSFLSSVFLPAWNTHLKLLSFRKDAFTLNQQAKVTLQVCFEDDNILISYARVPRLSPGCHILTFSIILRKPCKLTLFCNKNLNFVAYFLCHYVPAPWASLQGINDSSPINQMPKEAPRGGRDVHKSWNGFHNMAFNLVQSVEFKNSPIFQKEIPFLLIREARPRSYQKQMHTASSMANSIYQIISLLPFKSLVTWNIEKLFSFFSLSL